MLVNGKPKVEITKLSASLTKERESAKTLAEELKSAREEALKEFKESETFHEEAMAQADLNAHVGKQFLLDLGEMDYGFGYQDAQKEIYGLLKAKDPTFSPTRCGLPTVMTGSDSWQRDSDGQCISELVRDTVAIEEEYSSTTLQLNRRRPGSSERDPPTGPTEGDDTVEVPQSEA
nr:MAP7 domain-containing protein 1-like [Ipomoea batatas]